MTGLRDLEEDPDAPDDGMVLVAGVLYDAETGEEAECRHANVDLAMDPLDPARERLDAGTCADCGADVHLEPTEDGNRYWEID